MLDVAADYARCEGYANCIMAAPDTFDIDDQGVVVVLRDSVPDSDRDRVAESVRSCPVAALTLSERHD